MSYEKLKSQMKTGAFSQLMHFYGDEGYLKAYCLDKCSESLVTDFPEFNRLLFEGSVSADDLSSAVQTPPVMSGKKLIVLKNTGIFSASVSRKEAFAEIFSNLPDYAYLILCEDSFDRRNAVYKAFTAGGGMPVEFAYRKPGDIKAWVSKILSASKKQMDTKAMELFLAYAGVSMYNIKSQLDKLLALCHNKKTITADDVNLVVSKEPLAREYHLTDALLARNSEQAFKNLLELEEMKSEPVRLIYIIASSFLSAYKAKVLLSEGRGQGEVMSALGLPSPFLGKKTVSAAMNTDEEFLKNAISNLKDADYKVKTGEISPYTCIKLLCSAILENRKFS